MCESALPARDEWTGVTGLNDAQPGLTLPLSQVDVAGEWSDRGGGRSTGFPTMPCRTADLSSAR
jgi:hypothetical protein